MADGEEPTGAGAELEPGGREVGLLCWGFVRERLGVACGVNLDELHQAVHPGATKSLAWRAEESDDELGAGAVDFGALDGDDLADGDGLEATEVEDAFEDEIGGGACGAVGGCVASFEGEGEEGAGVERAMMIGVAGEDEAVCQGFLDHTESLSIHGEGLSGATARGNARDARVACRAKSRWHASGFGILPMTTWDGMRGIG